VSDRFLKEKKAW
jgi:hypothetical protein